MKALFLVSVCAFFLATAGVAFAHSQTATSDQFWSSWLHGVSVIWQPFLFAFVIVFFGTWAIQRLNRVAV